METINIIKKISKLYKKMNILKASLIIVLLSSLCFGCWDDHKDYKTSELGVSPEDLWNEKNRPEPMITYNLYELQLVTGGVIRDTLTFDHDSNYMNDRLRVYADKVVYARILKDRVKVERFNPL